MTGGWNAPHPDTHNNASTVFREFQRWNREVAARPMLGFCGFDGIDWDLEGNDDVSSPFNHFSIAVHAPSPMHAFCPVSRRRGRTALLARSQPGPQVLDLVGEVSQLAKRAGLAVSMAPPEVMRARAPRADCVACVLTPLLGLASAGDGANKSAPRARCP